MVTVILSGCGLFGQEDPTVEPSQDPPAGTLTLLDPGAEPRKPVTFTFVTGTSVDLDFRVALHLTQRTSDAETTQVLDPPTTRQTVRLTVRSTDPDGAEIDFEVIDAGIDPSDTDLTDVQIMELTSSIQAVVGLNGRLHVDSHGRMRSVRYDDQDEIPEEVAGTMATMQQNLTSLVPLLPTEPIGRGARWRTVSYSGAAGLTLRQTSEYEVTAIGDDRLTYRATITQAAPEQAIDADEEQARLLAADIVGTATGMVSTNGLASESETSLRGSQVIEQVDPGAGAGSSPRRVTQDLDLLVSVAPAEPGALEAPPGS